MISGLLLPILLGGVKGLGIVYINIIRGAKEPRNLQNHRELELQDLGFRFWGLGFWGFGFRVQV